MYLREYRYPACFLPTIIHTFGNGGIMDPYLVILCTFGNAGTLQIFIAIIHIVPLGMSALYNLLGNCQCSTYQIRGFTVISCLP